MGRVGSLFPVAFFKLRQQPHIYLCMQFKDNSIMQRVLVARRKKHEEEKDDKKAS